MPIAVIAASLCLTVAAAAGTPTPLTAEQQSELAGLTLRRKLHAAKCDFGAAWKESRKLAAFWAGCRGERHWRATDARYDAEAWRRLATVPTSDRAWVLRIKAGLEWGLGQLDRGEYEAAEASFRTALTAADCVVGPGHALAAECRQRLAVCVRLAGRPREALPVYRRAVGAYRKSLGAAHPETANALNSLALCLQSLGRPGDALTEHRAALAGRSESLGRNHPDTAGSLNNLAACLRDLARPDEALGPLRRALAVLRDSLGESDPKAAVCYNNLAACLNSLGRPGEALPVYRKALAVARAARGDSHPSVALGYHNLGLCLQELGRPGDALPLHRRAASLWRASLGRMHPHAAAGLDGVGVCLLRLGRPGDALPLHREALAVRGKALGGAHPRTAISRGNVAACLGALGDRAGALALYRSALADLRGSRGEGHPATAVGYNNVADCLVKLGRPGEALALYRRSLAIRRRVLGEAHPLTAEAMYNLATCQRATGDFKDAAAQFRRSLQAQRAALGEAHPHVASGYCGLALALWAAGERGRAERTLEGSLSAQEAGRFMSAATGFGRSLAGTPFSPHAGLAVAAAARGKPREAFARAEAGLARGLLDDLAGPAADRRMAALAQELADVGRRLVALNSLKSPTAGQRAERRRLAGRRRDAGDRLAGLAAAASSKLVLPLAAIQNALPADAALVYWVAEFGLHYGCVVRRDGPPHWVALSGTGRDDPLTRQAYRDASRPGGHGGRIRALARQTFSPLERHLAGVRRLLVVPDGDAALIPVGALTDRYVVSYVPSGSAFARSARERRPADLKTALVVADPRFGRGAAWRPLPGTRAEAHSLARLLPSADLLLGPDASQRRLQAIAAAGRLKSYRALHLATHGVAYPRRPLHTALVLSQDGLPDADARAERVLTGKTPRDGRLTVKAVLDSWELDADLVVLSACQSGLGKAARGAGMLGFSQALLQKGARAVVLTRWRVDDAATALLMRRFYQNLLGERPGLATPLGRADALHEAKRWLRGLSAADAKKLLAELAGAVPRAERGRVGPALERVKGAAKPTDRPFAAPYYWAAFALIGDPD